jgi:hypothetical protein
MIPVMICTFFISGFSDIRNLFLCLVILSPSRCLYVCMRCAYLALALTLWGLVDIFVKTQNMETLVPVTSHYDDRV